MPTKIEPLRKGQKVVMTEEAIKNGLAGRTNRRTGIVITDERAGMVSVHRIGDLNGFNYGIKIRRYAALFWKSEP